MRTGPRPRQRHKKQNDKDSGASERRQLEAELRASEDRFRLVLENSPSPIGVFDQTGSLRYVSPTIAAVFGLSPEEMLRRAALVHPLIGKIDPTELTAERRAELGVGHVHNAASWLHLMEKVIYCARHPGENARSKRACTAISLASGIISLCSKAFNTTCARSSSSCMT